MIDFSRFFLNYKKIFFGSLMTIMSAYRGLDAWVMALNIKGIVHALVY